MENSGYELVIEQVPSLQLSKNWCSSRRDLTILVKESKLRYITLPDRLFK
jgi:hypothetical protein